jgi:transcriptional regulator with XRE-family HTH domain
MTRLKLERLQRGWTQIKLAALSSLAASDISKIEAGVLRPYARQLVRLAAALRYKGDVERLLDDVDLSPVLDAPSSSVSEPLGT